MLIHNIQYCITIFSAEPTFDHTWYPNFAWRIAFCSNCSGHIGWQYNNKENTKIFFGFTKSGIKDVGKISNCMTPPTSPQGFITSLRQEMFSYQPTSQSAAPEPKPEPASEPKSKPKDKKRKRGRSFPFILFQKLKMFFKYGCSS